MSFRGRCRLPVVQIGGRGGLRSWRVFPFLSLLSLLMNGCSTKPDAITATESYSGRGDQPVFVVSHGWHTGIVLPAHMLTAANPVLERRFGGARYLEVGWGDSAFYQTEEVTVDVAVSAALWPTDAVVHIVEVPVSPESYFVESEVTGFCANAAQLGSLTAYVESSFARDAAGGIIPRRRGIYGNSEFYAGAGDFHLFNTCNKWTAKGLQSLGMDIDPTFRLTADSIMAYLAAREGASRSDPTHASCLHETTGERP